MSPGLKKLRRELVFPAAGITGALAALGLLAAPAGPAPRHVPRSPPAVVAPAPPATPRPGLVPPRATTPPPVAPVTPPRPVKPAAPPTAPPIVLAPPAAASGEPQKIDRSHGILPAERPESWDSQVARAEAGERLGVVDRAVRAAPPADAEALLERLLDRTPGANAEEMRALRAGLVARLGLFKTNPRAVSRLVSELDASNAPAERLGAIDALVQGGDVPAAARPALERLAADEPDAAVQKRARSALGIRDG